ncbi:MAG: MFS transporter [Pseudomonadota bacterium]
MTIAIAETEPKTSRKGIFGWMMFDWAAQPFYTVVTTFIFGPYFVSRMASDPVAGQAAWGYGIAAAGFCIAILSPILGSIADQTGPRKPWIAVFACVKIAMLSLLWLAAPGSNLFWVVAIFSLASVAAEFSSVFNDSMMPRLVRAKDMGRISNIAWGMGYAGGMVVLIIVVLFMAVAPGGNTTLIGMEPLFGLDADQGEDARITGPMAALWYLIFILPMFLFTPDTPRQSRIELSKAVRDGLAEIKSTLAEARRKAGLLRFLIARMIYQDGVNAILALGGAFAAGLFGWSILEIGIFGIILNIVAIPACMVAAWLDGKFGSKNMVIMSIFCLMVATVGIVSTTPTSTLFGILEFGVSDAEGLFTTPAEKAYIVYGLLIGLAFGPVQASSRAYMARSVHPEDAGRYFGIYALSGRVTSFAAPLLVAIVTDLTGSAAAGMSMIGLFLIVGLSILWSTPYPAANPVKD